MKNEIFKFERDLILSSLLRVISEGQLKTNAIPAVAYYSGLTEHTVRNIFPSVDVMLSGLTERVNKSVTSKIAFLLKENPHLTFHEKFTSIWQLMFEYYQRNPHVTALIDQTKTLGLTNREVLGGLIDFFQQNKNSLSHALTAETYALLLNANAMSIAKMATTESPSQQELKALATMGEVLWQGMKTQSLVEGDH